MDRHMAATVAAWQFNLEDADGRILRRTAARNLITENGLDLMARRAVGASNDNNQGIAVGTGTTAEDITDTALESQVGNRTGFVRRYAIGATEHYEADITYATAGGAAADITEAGIFTSTGLVGVMTHRVTTSPLEMRQGRTVSIHTVVAHRNGESL